MCFHVFWVEPREGKRKACFGLYIVQGFTCFLTASFEAVCPLYAFFWGGEVPETRSCLDVFLSFERSGRCFSRTDGGKHVNRLHLNLELNAVLENRRYKYA